MVLFRFRETKGGFGFDRNQFWVSVDRNPLTETREKQRKLVFQRMDKMRGFISPRNRQLVDFPSKTKLFRQFLGTVYFEILVPEPKKRREFEKLVSVSGFRFGFRFRETNWSKVSVSTETKKVVSLVH